MNEIKKEKKTKSEAEISDENKNLISALKQRQESRTGTFNDLVKESLRSENFKIVDSLEDAKETLAQESSGDNMADMAGGTDRHVSLKFGVVGSGQAGGRIAEVFYRYGYDACVMNTAKQDLELLDLPESSKLFLDYSLGGAGRDLEIGRAAVEENFEEVQAFLEEKTEDAEVLVLAFSGGGGSGSGSAEVLVEVASGLGKPIIVIFALPGSYDDAQSKYNAIQTLARMGDMASKGHISSLVLVDNAKIELAYPNLSQTAFWETANKAVVEPLHLFNSLTAMPTKFEALDTMDFANTLLDSGNCVLFGANMVPPEDYEEDDEALVEAIIQNLEDGLLASGFALEEAQSVGVLITARQEVLDKIPYQQIAYIYKYISQEYDSAKTFKGVYAVKADTDDVTVRFVFSGLGLPKDRVDSLKSDADKHMKNLSAKKKKSTSNMSIDLGRDKTSDQADRMISRLKKKKSSSSKLIKNKKVKRR